ncbi:MAG: alpha/beta fold hydrolase [Verrucomicrobiota bacterium]
MKFETEIFEAESGHEIRRYWYRPEGKPMGGVVMIHGLGDHLGRYSHVAKRFCDRGFLCVGVDLPGHGLSSGSRGHVPSFDLIGDLLDRNCLLLKGNLPEQAPIGVFAHSMGGLVALDYLPRRSELFHFAWISSPLIDPSAGQPPILVKLSKWLGPWLPWLSLGTGVRSELLRHPDPKTGTVEKDPLMHSKVSASFGAELIQKGVGLPQNIEKMDSSLKVLMSHGTEDHVCSPEASRKLFDLVPATQMAFVSVEGSPHEPLHDSRAEWLLEKVDGWLDELGFFALKENETQST